MASLSIVIPAYNEAKRLPRTLEQIYAYLQQRFWEPAEVIVVDDGSTDETAQIVLEFARRVPSVQLLQNPGNRGKGYSVKHGVLQARYEWVLFSDADLSAPIEEVEKLYSAVQRFRADGAIGSRALDRSLIEVHQSWFRENAGRMFNLMVRLFTGLPFGDTQCGFKLFKQPAARQAFQRQRIEGFGFDVEVLYILKKLGYSIVEVPVRWAHSEGTKVRLLRDSVNMFLDLLRIRYYDLRGYYD